ncbi:hypothetical protein GGI25_005070 [Coemansia spiralis]|uniref:DUF2470 domain-containing protein n=2 Tax=Coemansia TaxID=4863 RepID=A0A9W8G5D1_9FUNG|nr:hypothetical protein EDC05_002333 [Coemansia umbellata]KAJ2619035.1 hypothetical protein GGI26_006155 [Coemansia sp. RSA 1358]KAJ2672515.1 hypothetical protein GGI25_005070 [Coemansia spiralis]
MSFPQNRQRQRQKQKQSNPLDAGDQERLKERLNTTYADDILIIARYFGDSLQATSAHVIDIDSQGVVIEWKSEDAKTSKQLTEEMRFAFRGPSGPGAALQEISDLASEASKALGLTEKPRLTKDREAVEARTLVSFEFKLPSVQMMVAVISSMSLLGYLALVDDIHPALKFFRYLVSQDTCHYMFVCAIILHLFEAFVVYIVCQLIKIFQPRQMSTKTQIQWTIGGLFFGLFSLHEFIKKLKRQFALADSMNGPSLAAMAANARRTAAAGPGR